MNEKEIKRLKDAVDSNLEKERREILNNPKAELQLPLPFFPEHDATMPTYTQGRIEKEIVFLSNSSRNKSIIVYKDDDKRVTIGKVGDREYGVFKTRHRDLVYAVLYLWAKKHFPRTRFEGSESYYGYISTSKYELLKLLKPNDYKANGKDYKNLMGTLYDLGSIPVEVFDPKENEEKRVYKLFFSVNYDSDNNSSEPLEIYLNKDLTDSYYLKDKVMLFFFDIYRNFSSDVAKTLYIIIDGYLRGNQYHYNIKVDKLCNLTGLTRYSHNSKQINHWNKALKELDGCLISSMNRIKVDLYENKDKELVFSAVPVDCNSGKLITGH